MLLLTDRVDCEVPVIQYINYIHILGALIQGCQYRSGHRSSFFIGTERFGIRAFRRAISGLYCSYIINYIYIYIYMKKIKILI